MAQLDNYKRILAEDFPQEDRETIEKLAFVLNIFMEQVVSAFDNNINFDNLNQEIKTITVTVNGSGTPKIDTKVKNNLSTKVKGFVVLRAFNLDNTSTYPTSQPFISFTESGDILTITNISGLQADNKYQLVVLSIG